MVERRIGQSELAQQTGLSQGHLSKVLRHLEMGRKTRERLQEWLEQRCCAEQGGFRRKYDLRGSRGYFEAARGGVGSARAAVERRLGTREVVMNMHHMIRLRSGNPVPRKQNPADRGYRFCHRLTSLSGEAGGGLFSGTSVVGKRLSQRNPVVAVDVQAYADILGRAMLMAEQKDFLGFDAAKFLIRAECFARRLTRIFSPLIDQEAAALDSLSRGDPAPMSEIIERGLHT